ncbi:MAG: PKD domain-containing protein [Planctomycetota bacterium]|jgi:hypothetical protein
MKINSKATTALWSLTILLLVTSYLMADPPGLLVVHPTNPRYCMVQGDPAQKAVFLTGSHTWAEFQDYQGDPAFTWTDWLNQLGNWGHNFFRGWQWEDGYYSPLPHPMSGGKYDLHLYNATYFDRLKTRIQDAANHNPPYWLSIMLFEGWSITDKNGLRSPDPWPQHPYKLSNNNNGINGDPNGDGDGNETHTMDIPAVTALQEDYVEHTIDELNGYDNIIWEIVNETPGTDAWQYHMVDHIHNYEAGKPKQHLVWINVDESQMYNSSNHAEVVSPRGSTVYRTDPPAANGQKVIIADSDHTGPLQVTHPWAWRNFVRGNQPILMDCKYQDLVWWTGSGFNPGHAKWQQMRDALGIILSYANRMDLVPTVPQNGGTNPANTGNCLYNTGTEYMVYQPTSGASITINNLSSGQYNYEWIHPYNGLNSSGSFTWAGGNKSFGSAPFSGDSALYVYKSGYPVAVIDANPTIGYSPLSVNFDGSNSYDFDGNIVSYEWDFENDGNIDATGVTTSHVY